MRDPNKKVTFAFRCYEKESVDLKIRLGYDNLKQGDFFRSLLKYYIENDSLMRKVVDKIKEERGCMGKRKILRSEKEIIAGKKIEQDLSLSDSDRENLFDLIEEIEDE